MKSYVKEYILQEKIAICAITSLKYVCSSGDSIPIKGLTLLVSNIYEYIVGYEKSFYRFRMHKAKIAALKGILSTR